MEVRIVLDGGALARRMKGVLGSWKGRLAVMGGCVLLPMLVYGAISRPYSFTDGTVISAAQMNANFDTVYNEVNRVANVVVPVGGILAWHKSMSGTPALPTGWVECNGQVLSDSASVYNGQTIPNLNGDGRFLRGSTSSGALQADELRSHRHYNQPPQQPSMNTDDQNFSYPAAGDWGPPLVRAPWYTDYFGGAETRPINMSVVWIMRVR